MRCPKPQLFCSFGSENVGIIRAEKSKFIGVTAGLLCGSLIPDECFIMSGPLSLFMQCQLAGKGNGFSPDHSSTLSSSCLCLVLRSVRPSVCCYFSAPNITLPSLYVPPAMLPASLPPSSILSGGCYSTVVSVKATSACSPHHRWLFADLGG